jgi:hypothetical protein
MLNTAHNYSTMDQNMEILHIERKGPVLTTLENVYAYKTTKAGLQLNGALINNYNRIFDILIKASSNFLQPPTHEELG